MNSAKDIRNTAAAGSFYPQDPDILQKDINKYLDQAKNFNIDNIKTIVCPHAGYMFSGQTAAYSYKQIMNNNYDSIIIIAPSHSDYFDFTSIYDGKAYRTPIGLINIDTKRALTLANYNDKIKISPYGHGQEHSVEVQLPFLQVIFEDMKIIPIVMGRQSRQNIEVLGNAIGSLFMNENILIVASTDLSHFHPYNEAISIDKKAEQLISKFDYKNLMEQFLSQDIEMCGGGPVISSMLASIKMGASASKVLYYTNSGNIMEDKSAVVGYLSAIFFKE